MSWLIGVLIWVGWTALLIRWFHVATIARDLDAIAEADTLPDHQFWRLVDDTGDLNI